MSDHEEKKREGLSLSERELSHIIVGLLLGGFLLFVSGYYLGKRRACEEFAFGDDVQFAQKVQSALSALAGRGESDENSDGDVSVSEVDAAGENCPAVETVTTESPTDTVSTETPTSVCKVEPKAYARLCGFGSKAAAEGYVKKLAKREITAHITERVSKTPRGRKIFWYQVSTETMPKNVLIGLIDEIKRRDKLSDVSIIDMSETVS